MKFRDALLGATLLALPVVAHAQPVSGLYVGAGAGVNFKTDQSFTGAGTGAGDSFTAQYRQPGFALVGSMGWGFGNGLRAEVEGSWRKNSINHNTGGEGSWAGGTSDTYAVMVNALYDFNNLAPWIVPYVGGGVGYGWQHFNNAHLLGSSCGYYCPDWFWNGHGTTGGLAWQGIVGAAFPIAAVPGLSLTAEYRIMGVMNSGAIPAMEDFATHSQLKPGNDPNHSVLLGVRYAFNAAPAPVPAAPAAVAPAAKSYLIFFDWDKSTLTDRARAIIKEAAAASKTVRHTQLEVNGYADTSGNPQYNRGLSMRRAQTAAAELVRNGVPKQEIAIKAFGDTVLLVPTGPGVREPQNRRVEIIIR